MSILLFLCIRCFKTLSMVSNTCYRDNVLQSLTEPSRGIL
nr:MAG TPA: ubiquitin carboxyl-terminal hydrolase [Bacteriophage sp.]